MCSPGHSELVRGELCMSCQVGLCTAVCAVRPGLLDAKLGSVHLSVQSALAFWAPSWALYTRLCSPPWPPGRQVGLCTANMSSNLPSSCPSRALLTCKIINFP